MSSRTEVVYPVGADQVRQIVQEELAKVFAASELIEADFTQIESELVLDVLQRRAHLWAKSITGDMNLAIRARRFFEEAVELAQAVGVSKGHATLMLDYIYERPAGQPAQEVGGIGMTLLPLCELLGVSAMEEFRREYDRVNTPEVLEKIRNRQAVKAAAGF